MAGGQSGGAGIIGKIISRQHNRIAAGRGGQLLAAEQDQAGIAARPAIGHPDGRAGNIREGDCPAAAVALAGAGAQIHRYRAAASIERAGSCHCDHAVPCFPVAIHHPIGQQVIADQGYIAAICGYAGIEKNRTAGLQGQAARRTGTGCSQNRTAERNIIGGLQGDIRAAREQVRDLQGVQRGCFAAVTGKAGGLCMAGAGGMAAPEQPHCPAIDQIIQQAIIKTGPGGQQAASLIQSQRNAELIRAVQRGERKVTCSRIAGAEPRRQRAGGEIQIAKLIEAGKTGISQTVTSPVICRSADCQTIPVPVQSHRAAQLIAGSQISHADILAACITLADNRLTRRVRKAGIGKADQPGRPGIAAAAIIPIITGQAHRHPVAIPVQSDRPAQLIACRQPAGREIAAAAIIHPDPPAETGPGKITIGKADQPGRPGICGIIICAIIPIGPDRQLCCAVIQRHRCAEIIKIIQIRQIEIFAARIALADSCLKRAAGKAGIGKAEQAHRPGIGVAIARPAIAKGPDRKAISVPVKGYGGSEHIRRLKRGDIHILAACIAIADSPFERAAGKSAVGKAEQMHRPAKGGGIARPIIANRANRQAIASLVQRHRIAEIINRIMIGKLAQNGFIGPALGLGAGADNDIFRVQQQAATAQLYAIQPCGAQRAGRG